MAAGPITDRARLIHLDSQAFHRLHLATVALRYAREFPLGTGNHYAPQARHVDMHWGTNAVQAALAFSPHNQFLLCLVQYGVPGLVLLGLLYGGVAWNLIAALRRQLRVGDEQSLFLLAAVSAALAGYVVNSQFHDHGPFTKDWFHFLLLGLALTTPALLRSGWTTADLGDGVDSERAPCAST